MAGGIRAVRCDRGVAAIELAIGLPAFLILVLGIIYTAILGWTLGSLHYAAETAARCASVDPNSCGSAGAVENYALAHYYGESLGPTNPFVSSATGCGHTVSASYNYSFNVPLAGNFVIPLSTTACFP